VVIDRTGKCLKIVSRDLKVLKSVTYVCGKSWNCCSAIKALLHTILFSDLMQESLQ